MRKIKVLFNVSLDGFCDHTALIPDEELFKHSCEFFDTIDVEIWGRKTFELMEGFWPLVVKDKDALPIEVGFAEKLDQVQKYVISRTLKKVTWINSKIIHQNVIEEITKLKQQDGKDIAIGSPSIILLLTKAGLIDEFNFLIYPIVLGKGIRLFYDLEEMINLVLIKSEIFKSGVVSAEYKVKNKI